MTTTHDQVPEIALEWIESGRKVALATVIETWGSAPRQPGALLAISDDGELAGSVSGGCVEGAVAAEAIEAMEDGLCKSLEYGVSDDDAFAVGLACGGTIRIFVEPIGVGEGLPLDVLENLCTARAKRERTVTRIFWEKPRKTLAIPINQASRTRKTRNGSLRSTIRPSKWPSSEPPISHSR